MPKYLCLQRKIPNATAEKPSAADMQALYARFESWREKFRNNLTDLGGRLGNGTIVSAHPIPDGPLVEVKELVGGYMIVTAATLDEAIEIARECPGLLQAGSGVEVIEVRSP